MTIDREALLPCPFCGGDATLSQYETESLWSHDQVTYTQVGCEECDYHIATEPGYEMEAPERWNTRPDTAEATLDQPAQEPVALETDEATKLVEFLDEASRYFTNRPTGGEDAAHWANVYNSENCRKSAELIRTLYRDMRDLNEQVATWAAMYHSALHAIANLPDDLSVAISQLRALCNDKIRKINQGRGVRTEGFRDINDLLKACDKVFATLPDESR